MTNVDEKSPRKPAYRVFLLDDAGKITSRIDFPDLTDDEAAIREAQAIKPRSGLELWDGSRRVHRVDGTN